MPRAFVLPVLFSVFSVLSVYAQTAGSDDAARTSWEHAWDAALENASFVPSKLTREMIRGMIRERDGESVEARVLRALAATLRVERSLRLGSTYQETRARLRQTLRLEDSAGPEKGKRMAAKLAKSERKNSARGKGAASGARVGSGKNSGKDKNGR